MLDRVSDALHGTGMLYNVIIAIGKLQFDTYVTYCKLLLELLQLDASILLWEKHGSRFKRITIEFDS